SYRKEPWTSFSRTPLQQGSMSNMTDVRSYTNGHGRLSGMASLPQKSGDFVNALQDAVRENPISAALIGMGVLWMFMGGSNTSLFGAGGRKWILRSVDPSADVVGGVARDAATRVGASVGRVADAAAETVSHVGGGIRQASAGVADRASRSDGQAADAIASAATSAAHDVQETGSKWGNTVQQNIAELFERHPLLLGA